jgi:hypothetical protein
LGDLVICVIILDGEEFCCLGLLFFKEEFAVFLEVCGFLLFLLELGFAVAEEAFVPEFCAFCVGSEVGDFVVCFIELDSEGFEFGVWGC